MEFLNPNGKIKLHRSKLIEMGFDFNYFTNTYETKNGDTYHFCYDQGYLDVNEDFFAIVERQDYIK